MIRITKNLKTILLLTALLLAGPSTNLNSLPNWLSMPSVGSVWQNIHDNPLLIGSSVLIGLAGLYRLRLADKSMPTLEQLNVVTFIPIGKAPADSSPDRSVDVVKTLKQKNLNAVININGYLYQIVRGTHATAKETPITVYSGGYSNEGKPYAYCGYTAIKAGLVPGICVVFDFAKDTRRGFNFCQEQDQHSVDLVCKDIISKNPNAEIILHGACKGAANNLRYLSKQTEMKNFTVLPHIKAVIAESPPISAAHALKHTPASFITKILMRIVMPNHDPNAQTIMQAEAFPAIPVLVAALPQDTISELGDVAAMKDYLNNLTGLNLVELFESKEARIIHGQIGKAKDYQQEVQRFLASL